MTKGLNIKILIINVERRKSSLLLLTLIIRTFDIDMKGMLSLLSIFYSISLANAEKKFFSNFKPGVIYGRENIMEDYLTISENPVSNQTLPDKFTICSSLFLDLITTMRNVIQIFKEDGTHWFNLSIDVYEELRNGNKTERISLWYQTGKYSFLTILNSKRLCPSIRFLHKQV